MRSIWLDLSICQKLSCCCPLMGGFWSFGFLIYTLSCVHIKRGHFIFLILLLLVFVKYWANTSATFMEPWSQKSAGERSGEFGSQSIPSLRLPDIFLYWVEQAPYLELLPTEPNKKTPHDLNKSEKIKRRSLVTFICILCFIPLKTDIWDNCDQYLCIFFFPLLLYHTVGLSLAVGVPRT